MKILVSAVLDAPDRRIADTNVEHLLANVAAALSAKGQCAIEQLVVAPYEVDQRSAETELAPDAPAAGSATPIEDPSDIAPEPYGGQR